MPILIALALAAVIAAVYGLAVLGRRLRRELRVVVRPPVASHRPPRVSPTRATNADRPRRADKRQTTAPTPR